MSEYWRQRGLVLSHGIRMAPTRGVGVGSQSVSLRGNPGRLSFRPPLPGRQLRCARTLPLSLDLGKTTKHTSLSIETGQHNETNLLVDSLTPPNDAQPTCSLSFTLSHLPVHVHAHVACACARELRSHAALTLHRSNVALREEERLGQAGLEVHHAGRRLRALVCLCVWRQGLQGV